MSGFAAGVDERSSEITDSHNGQAKVFEIGSSAVSTGVRMLSDGVAATGLISVLVADDHPLLREGIAAVIQREKDMFVVAEASNGREAIERFREHRPDVALMDMRMPEVDGIASTTAIRAEWPDARVVMLTTYGGDMMAIRAFKAGACGYLLKSMIRVDLPDAIRSVHAGQRHIAQQVAAELAAHVTDGTLSAREVEVLKQVASGNSNRQIGERLFISEETVKAHIKNIMSKLSANDRTHAVMIGLRRGLIDM